MTQAELKKLASEIEANATPVPEWNTVDELVETKVELVLDGKKKKLNVEQAVELYTECDNEIKRLEAIKKEIKEPIQAGLLVSGVEKVMAAGRPITMVTKKGTKKIVAEKLLAQGVSAMVIAKATEEGKDSQYVLIGKTGKD